MENDLMLHDMSFHDGEYDMSLSGEAAEMFMYNLIKMFEQAGGKNFLTITVESKNKNDKYSITIENCNGNDTPAEKLQRLEQELEQTKIKLVAYEEAEEQGRLVVLPCSVGADLYFIDKHNDEIYKKAYVDGIGIHWTNQSDIGDYIPISVIGRTVFLNRETAEAALNKKG